MRRKINMIGRKFGKLTVIEECKERDKYNKIKYKCKCDCDNITIVLGSNLRRGNTTSCGCLSGGVTHGKRYTRLYNTYKLMKDRCYNKNNQAYKYYGKRGIKVCNEWLNDFMIFYDWAMSHGYNDNLTIDRINVDGDYEPDNCRWITQHNQCYNRRSNVYLTYNGKTQTMKEWAEELNVPYQTIRYRHTKGYIDKECLFGKVK